MTQCLCDSLNLLLKLTEVYARRAYTNKGKRLFPDTIESSAEMWQIAENIYDRGKTGLSAEEERKFQEVKHDVSRQKSAREGNPAVLFLDYARAMLHNDETFRRAFLCQKTDECTICEVDDALYILGETDYTPMAQHRLQGALTERGCELSTTPVIKSIEPPEPVKRYFLLRKLEEAGL